MVEVEDKKRNAWMDRQVDELMGTLMDERIDG